MTVQIGVLGAARISKPALFEPAAEIDGVHVVGVAAREKSRAAEQVAEFGLGRVFDSYRDLIDSPEVTAIYNPLPISLHHHWTIEALKAGKHVLCEKPFASNAAEAREMVAVAEDKGLVLMEAFHWRYHPLADRIGSILDSEVVGKVQRIEAAFTAPIRSSDAVRHNWELSGGALMDLGCYAVQWARFAAVEEPTVMGATMSEGRENVDISASIDLEFPSGASGHIYTAMADCEVGAWLTVTGSKGTLQVDNPIHPHMGHKLTLTTENSTESEIVEGKATYYHQLLAFRDAIELDQPIPTGGADAIATMEVIDAAYVAAGLSVRGVGENVVRA